MEFWEFHLSTIISQHFTTHKKSLQPSFFYLFLIFEHKMCPIVIIDRERYIKMLSSHSLDIDWTFLMLRTDNESGWDVKKYFEVAFERLKHVFPFKIRSLRCCNFSLLLQTCPISISPRRRKKWFELKFQFIKANFELPFSSVSS